MHFSSIPEVNNNQTVVVESFTETSQIALTAWKGIKLERIKETNLIIFMVGLSSSDNVDDPDLNIDNVLNCRKSTILSFSAGGSSAAGFIIAMDIRPLTGGPSTQTLFSIRDSLSNAVPFKAELLDSTGYLIFYRRDSGGSWGYYQSTLTLQKSKFD